MSYLSVTHTYIHGDKVRHAGPVSPLSQVSPRWSTTVRSLQTPCQRAPQAGGQAAWRQGPEAPVHTASPRTAERHTGWTTEQLAQDHGDGSSLGGDARGRMTRRQTGRDDAMSRISNSLTGTASDSRTGENEFADLSARSSSFARCEMGRTGTPACTGSV